MTELQKGNHPAQPGDATTRGARRGDGEPISPAACVVPILKQIGEGRLVVVGTGFFVTRYGLFATARHVLDDLADWESNTLHLGFVLQHDSPERFVIRQIVGISASDTADVAIGQAENSVDEGSTVPANLRCPLSLTRPSVGEDLVSYAYPENAVFDFREPSKPLALTGDYVRGLFRDQIPSGPFIPYPHYQTCLDIRSGASGCPIFANQRVVAIACRGWDFRGGEQEGDNLSAVIPVTQLLPIKAECARIPRGSWEYSQVPAARRSGVLTFAELVTYGHVDVGAL